MRLLKRPIRLVCMTLALPMSLCLAQAPANIIGGLEPANDSTLELFEAVETADSSTRPTSRPGRESRATTAAPEFTLVGVSRIGAKYSAILLDKDGDSVLVKVESGTNTEIPGHSSFALVDVSAASVSILYPSNNPCIEFLDRGVRCNDAANIADLTLATGEPVASNQSASRQQAVIASDAEEIIENQNAPRNPFEALRNARTGDVAVEAANPAGNASGARFTPRRINPEDVPEGMRIVATPFGDRLVGQ